MKYEVTIYGKYVQILHIEADSELAAKQEAMANTEVDQVVSSCEVETLLVEELP